MVVLWDLAEPVLKGQASTVPPTREAGGGGGRAGAGDAWAGSSVPAPQPQHTALMPMKRCGVATRPVAGDADGHSAHHVPRAPPGPGLGPQQTGRS